jgi:hypothetical protein
MESCNTNMHFLIRFVQAHETFRQPETDALAELHGLQINWLSYSDHVRGTSTSSSQSLP